MYSIYLHVFSHDATTLSPPFKSTWTFVSTPSLSTRSTYSWTFRTSIYPEFTWSLPQEFNLVLDIGTLDSSTGSIHLGVVAAHHFFLAVCLIVAGVVVRPNLIQYRTLSLLSGGNSRRIF